MWPLSLFTLHSGDNFGAKYAHQPAEPRARCQPVYVPPLPPWSWKHPKNTGFQGDYYRVASRFDHDAAVPHQYHKSTTIRQLHHQCIRLSSKDVRGLCKESGATDPGKVCDIDQNTEQSGSNTASYSGNSPCDATKAESYNIQTLSLLPRIIRSIIKAWGFHTVERANTIPVHSIRASLPSMISEPTIWACMNRFQPTCSPPNFMQRLLSAKSPIPRRSQHSRILQAVVAWHMAHLLHNGHRDFPFTSGQW